ncbi:MAG: folate transporter [Armatimonadetes bacterium]|jgi:Na+/melibiose symporter-like transporter|nr:folate transporter [Armatimonadota bacterium]
MDEALNDGQKGPDGPLPTSPAAVPGYEKKPRFFSDGLLVNIGWFNTGLALLVMEIPFKFLLKEQLGYPPQQVAGFIAIANIPIYIKPFAGILSDAVPMFGTRRRSYLLAGLILAAVFYLLLSLVPRSYTPLLLTYLGLSTFLTLTSTVLGGLMVEVGKRDHTTGRLSAQRLGISNIVRVISGPLGGWLATKAFVLTSAICGALYVLLIPLYWFQLHEKRDNRVAAEKLREAGRQARTLISSKILWAAAGLVILVVASPGFDTALLYHQRDNLHFDKPFIGRLEMIKGIFSMVGAVIYGLACRRMNLRKLLTWSIIIHSTMTLCYLAYKTPVSAMVITAIESATLAIALLPLYDLAARATPRGSEALGYSVMMSVWNFTKNMSDLLGSELYSRFGERLSELVWVNTVTTALVLIAVPFLPAALMDRRDGDAEPGLDGGH